MIFLYTFYKHQMQRRELLQSAFVEKARSVESVESMDVSEEFSRLLELSVELNFQVVKKGLKKNKKTIDMIKFKIIELFQSVSTSTKTKLDDIIVLAIVYFHMGILYSNHADIKKLYISETYFMKCLELLKGKECEPKTIMTTLRTLIELSLISSRLKKPEKHYFFLDQAMMLYLKYTNEENEYPDPIDVTNILDIENEEKHPKFLLEKFYSIIIERLIELYPSMSKNMHRFVIYFHNLLEKQMTEIISKTNAESMEWAQTSLILAMYLMQNCRFTEARNHIAAAEYIMDTYRDIQDENYFSKEALHFYKKMRTQIAEYWGIYGLKLLRLSRCRFLQDEEDNTLHEIDNSKSEFCTKPEKELMKFLIFADLEKDLEKKYLTNQITDKYVLNFNDAKIVFVNVLKCLNETKKYYSNTSKNNSIYFINLTVQMSFAYKYFVKYEQDKHKQINLCKLQIKILKEALQMLNVNGKQVLNTNLGASYCTQINCELILATSFILNINIDSLMLDTEQLTNKNSINKIPIEITELVSSNVDHLRNALKMFPKFV